MNNTPRQVPTGADPLGEALHMLRLTGSLYCRSELTTPWGIDMPELKGHMMFHVVTSGFCWLKVDGQAPVQLQQGSFALVPHGRGHCILSAPDETTTSLFDIPVQLVSDRYEVMHHGGGGALTQLTCGVVRFDHALGEQLVAQLPQILYVDTWNDEEESWLQNTMRFIAREARTSRPGGETVITHLADILIIQALRKWIDGDTSSHGWLAALRDKHIGTALTLIHRYPEKSWTVASLAREAGMSRSGFSARFTALIDEPVKHYLTRWRMQLAKQQLITRQQPLIQVAEGLGYRSEAAFCRAFKRFYGRSPGAYSLHQKSQKSLSAYSAFHSG